MIYINIKSTTKISFVSYHANLMSLKQARQPLRQFDCTRSRKTKQAHTEFPNSGMQSRLQGHLIHINFLSNSCPRTSSRNCFYTEPLQ
eukprot:c41096_g1_i1 orf=122-385(-)